MELSRRTLLQVGGLTAFGALAADPPGTRAPAPLISTAPPDIGTAGTGTPPSGTPGTGTPTSGTPGTGTPTTRTPRTATPTAAPELPRTGWSTGTLALLALATFVLGTCLMGLSRWPEIRLLQNPPVSPDLMRSWS
jgi:hypothetical protein